MGEQGLTKTKGELLSEAGYSEAIQKNPYLIFESETIQEGLSDVVKDLEKLRRDALNELKSRDLSQEQYRDIIKGIDTLTKNHQLLTGGDTERSNQPLIVKILGNDGNTAQSNGDTR